MVGFIVRNTHTGPQIPPATFLYTATFLLTTSAYYTKHYARSSTQPKPKLYNTRYTYQLTTAA